MSAFRLDGSVALVTGARPGIGGAMAAALCEAGAEVVLANRTAAAAEELAAQLREAKHLVHVVPFEATEQGVHDTVRGSLEITGGRLDIVMHNAGGCQWRSLDHLDATVLEETFELNLKSCFWITQAALPALRRSANGRIVITSSITGPRVAMADATHYAAAKAGVNGFIKAAALELARSGITINGVEPGMIAKDHGRLSQPATLERIIRYIPLRRAGRPQDIGSAALFLASREAAWITGQTIVVDGGATLPESGYAMEDIWARDAA
jgi:3-oxoacyl-[acyl-carrier protein] reductase